MNQNLNAKYHRNGIFNYETHVALKERARELRSEIAGLSGKLADLDIPVDLDEQITDNLLPAIKSLDVLDKYLSDAITAFRAQFSPDDN